MDLSETLKSIEMSTPPSSPSKTPPQLITKMRLQNMNAPLKVRKHDNLIKVPQVIKSRRIDEMVTCLDTMELSLNSFSRNSPTMSWMKTKTATPSNRSTRCTFREKLETSAMKVSKFRGPLVSRARKVTFELFLCFYCSGGFIGLFIDNL